MGSTMRNGPKIPMHLIQLFLTSLLPRVKVSGDNHVHMSEWRIESCLLNRKLKQSDSCKARTYKHNVKIALQWLQYIMNSEAVSTGTSLENASIVIVITFSLMFFHTSRPRHRSPARRKMRAPELAAAAVAEEQLDSSSPVTDWKHHIQPLRTFTAFDDTPKIRR